MKINLVAGGLGFIGSHLIDRLLREGEYVICLDNLLSGEKENIQRWESYDEFLFIEGDILDIQSVDFDKLWHLACPASPKRYLKDPILTAKINFEGTLNLLNLAKDQKAKVLFTSSSEVYGDCKRIPQGEDFLGVINTNNQRSCYSHGKRIAETLCFDFQRRYKMDIKIARIFNTYGPRLKQNDGRVISNFINQALLGEPLTINGDGLQTRSFCYISDVIDALILLMETEFNGPINVGNSSEIEILQLAKLIDKKIYSKEKFLFNEFKCREPIRRCPSLKLIKRIIDWSPSICLEDGLDMTIRSFKECANKN